jgi:hypothetical protein
MSIEDVKRKYEAELMALPGVIGVGIGKAKSGARVIQVLADEVTRALRDKVPPMLEGFFVELVRVGEIRRQ